MALCIESGLLHAILSINILSVKDKENIWPYKKYLTNKNYIVETNRWKWLNKLHPYLFIGAGFCDIRRSSPLA